MNFPSRLQLPVFALALALAAAGCGSTERSDVRQPVAPLYGVSDPGFRRSVDALLGPGLVGGNRAGTLLNGDRIFPAMIGAIRGARRTVHLESYIFWAGKVGNEFSAALAERARAGVKVRVLVDWQGSRRLGSENSRLMRDAGVELARYHRPNIFDVARVNNRTHRKLLIVDGKTGFIGGVGIADLWRGNADAPDHWRDNHYRVEGPVVAQLQAGFLDNWLKTRGELLHGDDVFPRLPAAASSGGALAQVVKSSPEQGNTGMRTTFLLSIASARRSIRVENAYFVPDDLFIQELVAARGRGVRVEFIVPGQHIDSKFTRAASRSRWGRLLAAGVEIREFQPTMIHSKLLIVDDLWVSVGSTNFDNRSFRLNDEANLNVLDRRFAAEQTAIFERDKTLARRITLEEWNRRPLAEKLSTPFSETFRTEL